MENVNMHVLSYIAKDITLSVTRLGINTRLLVVEKKDYKNNPYLVFESTPFQTTPMMFKEIKLEGNIYIREDETDDGFIYVIVDLDYRYNFFDGGSNGHKLGMCKYKICRGYWDAFDSSSAGVEYETRKVQGLTI